MPAHEIDYRLIGEEMQAVEVELDPGESVIAEAGSLMMMDPSIRMDTVFGDGSSQDRGIFGKLVSAGKRLLTGEGLFMTVYTHQGEGKARCWFASPYPGKIIPVNLAGLGGSLICQKDAFLCAAKGVAISIAFQKKLGTGLFGGEGFIMEKIEGDGMAFIHSGGTIIEKQLAPGQKLKVDTGCLVGFTGQIQYDIEFIGGLKNAFFGGEGFFLASLQGPGTVYVQSLPFSRLADRIIASAPKMNGNRREEGSVLGGLGNLLDGDNRF